MRRPAFQSLSRDFSSLCIVHTRPYCYRCPLGLKRSECAIDCLGDLERILAERGAAVAAVIVEPMLQGAGGMIVWPSEFLAGVRRLCDQYGTLMIADEVLTGFGRTGRMFACEHASVSPDLICLSKAMTAGYLPLAVTAVTESDLRSLSQRRPHESVFSRTLLHGESSGLCCRAGELVFVSHGGNSRASKDAGETVSRAAGRASRNWDCRRCARDRRSSRD